MSALITPRHIADYQRDGVVVVRNLLNADWLRILAEGVERNLKGPTSRSLEYVNDPRSGAHFFFDACTYGQNDAYDRLMTGSLMAETAARLMGSSRATLFYMTVFVRSAGTRNRTPWHQDQPSWSVSGEQACSVWTSLDPVPAETSLEFVRGSHTWPTEYQRPPFFHNGYENDDHTALPEFPDIESNRGHYDIVSWAMEPGDCVVFHGMTAHGGSGGLPTGLGRRAVSVQWLGDDARFRELAGGDDPDISRELRRAGLQPGEPVDCDLCPVVWRRDGSSLSANARLGHPGA